MEYELPQSFVAIGELGEMHTDLRYPVVDVRAEVVLEPGERILETYLGQPRLAEQSLSDKVPITVTDRRVVWVDTRYDRGGGWSGFGGAGLVVATVANAASKARARRRSAGKAAIGQIRYEWLLAIDLTKRKPLIGSADSYVDLHSLTSSGSGLVRLYMGGGGLADQLARYLAQIAATRLLTIGSGVLADTEMQRLATIMAGAASSSGQLGAARWLMTTDINDTRALLRRLGQSYGDPSPDTAVTRPW